MVKVLKDNWSLARCFCCDKTITEINLYKIILDTETKKALSVHSITLCKPCMKLLQKEFKSIAKE